MFVVETSDEFFLCYIIIIIIIIYHATGILQYLNAISLAFSFLRIYLSESCLYFKEAERPPAIYFVSYISRVKKIYQVQRMLRDLYEFLHAFVDTKDSRDLQCCERPI